MKKRVAGPADEHDERALLEMADRAPAQEGLGDLAHLDRGHQPRRQAALLERVLHPEPVDRGREEPHVVAGHAVDPLRGRGDAADDVAAAEDDGDLDAEGVDVADLVGDPGDDSGSIPKGRSPINASPESFRRMRR